MVGSSIQKQRYDQLKIEGTGFATNIREFDLSQMMLINRQASDTIAREKIIFHILVELLIILKENIF